MDEIPEKKVIDYSFHQAPTTNLLKDIQDRCGIKITIIGAQFPGKIKEVKPGLSAPMREAVRQAADLVANMVAANYN